MYSMNSIFTQYFNIKTKLVQGNIELGIYIKTGRKEMKREYLIDIDI